MTKIVLCRILEFFPGIDKMLYVVGVGMTGIAGEERQTGHFPCLQIYTLHNEQCMATEDF